MTTDTYHLDQRVRGLISAGRIRIDSLDKYRDETILPCAVLEYAGIGIKPIFLKIEEPKEALKSQNLPKVKEYFDNQMKEKLPIEIIERNLNERISNDNIYARPFAQKCLTSLSKDKLYDLLISQLSWDRFSQIHWHKHKSHIFALRNIARLIIKENLLYVLRHAKYTNLLFFKEGENEIERCFFSIIDKVKIKPNMDIGDCELIHVAINGQSSGDFKKKRKVDCYTMDSAKEIKRRLILCMFFYGCLEIARSLKVSYKFDLNYCGRIYFLNETGGIKEVIDVKDYLPVRVVERIQNKDLDTLFLMN